ncbi:MAG: M4 family metallopeptidase, partial [Thermoleophilia bacterium]|nr:M4 family metallopeptidase [Thermoleophilia bacterium]
GTLVRKDDQAPTGDKAVDAAHDNAALVHDFYANVLGRDSIDGNGMEMKSVVHYGVEYNNAYWDGEKMTYGDGDGKLFSPLSGALDVVGHEMTHGITEHSAGLDYHGQSGALNESWSDVFGELIEQYSENRSGFGTIDAAKGADWLIGEDVFTPGTAGDALRSMKAPGTAYEGDPQPADMAHYAKMPDDPWHDNGGVHYNSGIPNRAAYEAGVKIGGDKLAKVWYSALTQYLKPNSNFADAAAATIAAATKLYGAGDVSSAVADAWSTVGVLPATTQPKPAPVKHESQSQHGEAGDGIVPPWLVKPGARAALK